jgi:exopolysaccharide biosynthesis polyprenyl glycosylphosphotransferase
MKSMLDNTAYSTYRPAATTAGIRPLTGIVASDQVKKLLLLVGDIAALYASLVLTLVLRVQTWPRSEVWMAHLLPFSALFGVWILVFYIGDLYEIAVSKNEVKFYSRLLRTLWLNCGITAAYFYFVSPLWFDIRPQGVLILFCLTGCVLIVPWRYGYNALVQQPSMQRNVLVVGLNEGARDLIEEIFRNPQLGYRISAVVHDGAAGDNILPGVAVYDDSVGIKDLLIAENISTVVTAFDPRSNPRLIQHLFESLALKVQFFELPVFYEKLTGKIPVTNIGHIWFLENLTQSDKGFYEFLKRALDFIFATVLLLGAMPFIPFVLLALKLDSKGPAFFFQTRTGLLGKPFRAIKFRTMRVEAEIDGVARWAQKNDPRITRVGRFLRKTRIDEIPQLWNVLRGEMSMIGPRPERPEFVKNLEKDIPFYNERHLVKPGVTGWAQVRFRYGSSVSDSFKKLEYDFFYIKNRSIALDLAILLKTVSIVLNGEGQ